MVFEIALSLSLEERDIHYLSKKPNKYNKSWQAPAGQSSENFWIFAETKAGRMNQPLRLYIQIFE